MTKQKLKLVKTKKNRIKQPLKTRPRSHYLSPNTPHISPLTPAESSEAARFRALTVAKAARRAKVHQIIVDLEEVNNILPAA